MRYKDQLKMNHPYPGDTPEKCVEESIPEMTGHDDTVQFPQQEPIPFRDVMFVPSERDTVVGHAHPGDPK